MDEDTRPAWFAIRPHSRIPFWWEVVRVQKNGVVEVVELRAYMNDASKIDSEKLVNAFDTEEEADGRLRLSLYGERA